MTGKPVEWVLVVFYGPAAHKATYGRLGHGYTKDYIQLYRTDKFLEPMAHVLSVPTTGTGTVPITFRWPRGSARGDFVFRSADRPHLKWETSQGAPPPWKMTRFPSDSTSETIPGNPDHTSSDDADRELAEIKNRGAGQPYLMAIKLKDESRVFHLRTYLDHPTDEFAWADLQLVPDEVRTLARHTSQSSTLAWSLFKSGGIAASSAVEEALAQLEGSEDRMALLDGFDAATGRALAAYLRDPGDGLFFDPRLNHDAWSRSKPLPMTIAESVDDLLQALEQRFPANPLADAAAEELDTDPDEVEEFQQQIEQGKYAVPDTTTTAKTRGSAQRAFAREVKATYGYRCAITGITTPEFLIASHIVPWSADRDIRLDPSNGICLSTLVDRAFEKGYLIINDDLTILINESLIDGDEELRQQLRPLHGKSLTVPERHPPRPEYLKRRRTLVASGD